MAARAPNLVCPTSPLDSVIGVGVRSELSTVDAEAEYHLLWIAVEALRAPLLPLWRRRADGSFEHLVTHKMSTEHPMLHVFAEHVQHQRARKYAGRPYADLEHIMLFASADADGSGCFYFNFKTRQRVGGRRLPPEAIAALASKRRPPRPSKSTDLETPTRSPGRGTDHKGGGPGGGGGPRGNKPATPSSMKRRLLPEQRPLSRDSSRQRSTPHAAGLPAEAVGHARAQSAEVRRSALALRPRCLPDLLVAARSLGVNLSETPQLTWLVDLVLACDYLPSGWEELPAHLMLPLGMTPEEASLHGLGHPFAQSDRGGPRYSATRLRDVQRLPRAERARHMAATSRPPTQYASQLCAHVTEWHPLDGFVRAAVGAALPS